MQGAWDTGTWDDALWDSLPVTGNSAAGSPGSVGASASVPLTGNAAAGQSGSVSPTVTVALSGAGALGQVGNVNAAFDVQVSGASAAGHVGAVAYSSEVAITGNTATGNAGNETPSVTVALSGVSASGEVGSVSVVLPPIIIVDDGHDGKPFKKQLERERRRNEGRRKSIIDAYEMVVEGRPEIAEELAAPFVVSKVVKKKRVEVIDFDAMFADLDRVQQILDAQSEIDDEDVLALI